MHILAIVIIRLVKLQGQYLVSCHNMYKTAELIQYNIMFDGVFCYKLSTCKTIYVGMILALRRKFKYLNVAYSSGMLTKNAKF
jgi:hypothetical protein